MEFFVSTLLFGISVGGQYALIAIGYTMVYGILRLINFAHGDVFMVAGLLGIYLSSFLSAYLPPAAVIPVSLLLVLALTVALGFCIERAAYKPLRSAPRMSVMISAIGVSYLLQNSATYITGGQPMTYPSIPFLSDTISLAGTSIKWVVILTPFLVAALVLVDSNMYGEGGWFYSGFDRIHEDQTRWCMERLDALKAQDPTVRAMAFFHMPPREFKEAYEKMKLGDRAVIYRHGSVGEKDEYFGISKYEGDFFEEAVRNGVIRWIFCGHDHLNTLSLEYKGIRMTYGMSIDYLGYRGIRKSRIQRGGTLITRRADGSVEIRMLPLDSVVSQRVRGEKKK